MTEGVSLVASMVMLKSTVEEAVTVESKGNSWELPVRKAVHKARSRGRTPVVVVHSWSLSESNDFETLIAAQAVNGNGRPASVNRARVETVNTREVTA